MSVQAPSLSVSPKSEELLFALSKQLGVPARHLLTVAIEDFYQKYQKYHKPIMEIPGVNPADVWEAYEEIKAGLAIPHEEVFARLRNRSSELTRVDTPIEIESPRCPSSG